MPGEADAGQPCEESLVEAAAAGDRDALAGLVAAAAPRVRAALALEIPRKWQSMISEEDILQEAVADALVSVRSFRWRGPGSFGAWFSAIARHNLLNAIRLMETAKRGGQLRRVVAAGRPDRSSYDLLLATIAGEGLTPSGESAQTERHQRLVEAIERLPPAHRLSIELFDLNGLPASEVAERLGRSIGAMHMVRARAHRMLREILGASADAL